MKTRLALRIASFVMFLFALGHSLGGMKSWSPAGDNDVLRAMRSVHFNAAGNRTYLDFYTGFGWTLSIFLLLQAVLLWQLAAIAESNPRSVRPFIESFFNEVAISLARRSPVLLTFRQRLILHP